MASLDYKASRLVRSVDAATGQRAGFGEGGATEVVSARCALTLTWSHRTDGSDMVCTVTTASRVLCATNNRLLAGFS